MLTGYKVASIVVLALLGLTWTASMYGWGLPSDASVRARSVREGSVRGRHIIGGGPSFGK